MQCRSATLHLAGLKTRRSRKRRRKYTVCLHQKTGIFNQIKFNPMIFQAHLGQFKRINIALSDIIEETFDIAHLKDARTGKYIQSSPGFAEKLGLESARDVI